MRIDAVVAPVGVLALSFNLLACSSSKTTTPPTSSSVSSTATTVPGSPAGSTSTSPTTTSPTTTVATTTVATSSGSSAEMDACSLMSTAQLAAITGSKYTSAKSSTIATGQDQCDYQGQVLGVTVIVYQPSSGANYAALIDASGADKPVAGVGDKAAVGAIELDVQAGTRLIAVENAGGTSVVEHGYAKAVAVAKLLVGALGHGR